MHILTLITNFERQHSHHLVLILFILKFPIHTSLYQWMVTSCHIIPFLATHSGAIGVLKSGHYCNYVESRVHHPNM